MKVSEKIGAAYRYVVDHLTKALGALGVGIMTWFSTLDPAQLRSDIQSYLGDHAVEKTAGIIFGLVILRGWYTGWKSKQPK